MKQTKREGGTEMKEDGVGGGGGGGGNGGASVSIQLIGRRWWVGGW